MFYSDLGPLGYANITRFDGVACPILAAINAKVCGFLFEGAPWGVRGL